ncbi:TolC family protein [Sandaracinobacter sp. RS1-74]|uniref:TolC family protein n=1 Tax=Sandaracinobacteroides sayramensis TaxID=2913411 RepID=UPI001EDB0D9A|nr:TolC family protein [Sandaracinobacteroides sayramensis]MCG2840152.1 TolC family protein [Sandaracinobacteroides sayramensis]
MQSLQAAILAVCAFASVARAEPPASGEPGAIFTLARALELAERQSPLLEAAGAEGRAAAAARTVAGLRPNPSLSFEMENFGGRGDYRGTRSAEGTVSFGLPLELGGKRSARLAAADAGLGQVAIAGANAEADLKLAVTENYALALAAGKRLAVARDEARIAAEGLRAAKLRVEAGRASPIEAQRAELARINADAAVESAARAETVARLALARLVGAPWDGRLDSAWFAAAPAWNKREASGSLALAAAQSEVALAEAGVRLAHSQRVPDLTLSVGARRFAESDSNAALVSLSLPVPLFGNGRAALEQARAERQAAEARSRHAGLQLEQEVERAQAEAETAAAIAGTATGPALAAAEESARIARIGYANGKFGQLDLLEAERALSETRARAIDAQLATHIAVARLERLTARAPAQSGNSQ